MGLFSGLFGSSEQKTKVPGWIKGPAKEMLQLGADMAKTGYIPWTGPSVAALDPAQVGAMRNNASMLSAFGMDATMPSIQEPQDFGGGIFGYSSMPLYNQNMKELQLTRPGQMDYYNSFFVDPFTGQAGSRMNQRSQGLGFVRPQGPKGKDKISFLFGDIAPEYVEQIRNGQSQYWDHPGMARVWGLS